MFSRATVGLDGFHGSAVPTLGIEEEVILVEPETLEPADRIDTALELLGGDRRYMAELRAAQLEFATPVCLAVADACRELAGARAHLAEQLEGRLRVLVAGTHPTSILPVTVCARPRYTGIALDWPWITRRGLPSGLHVHVGLGEPDEALAVYNAARSYLPELAALAANSPYLEGGDSGLASSRLKLLDDMPRSGIPPAFASWQEFARFARLGGPGTLSGDLSFLWWDCRPRPDLGTIEFRIADSQTQLEAVAAIAAICQALVVWLQARRRDGEKLPVHPVHLINENRWRAIGGGLDGELLDLDSGRPEPARERLVRLIQALEPWAAELGCAQELSHAWSLLASGGGAGRQRLIVHEHGLPALLEWLCESSSPGPLHALAEGALLGAAAP